VLIELASRLSTPVELPWASFEEMLGASFAVLPTMTEGIDTWSDAQEKGGWWGELPSGLAGAAYTRPVETPQPVTFAEPRFDGDAGQFPLHFLPYPSSAFLDGSLAHLPWLQEMPDPLTSAMWSSWVEINPATADRLGIAQGDIVEIASTQGTLRSAAMITPGIAPDIVAMPVGQGHRTFTRYASARGENPVELLAPITEPATGALAWAATRVRVSRAGDPDGRLILFAGGLREHEDHGR
jgi:anaerobic selenocysteine-containing dehydrogenase